MRDFSKLEGLRGVPDDTLLTTDEVAALVGVTDVCLRLWYKQKRGPKRTYIENRPRYRLADVQAWMSGKSAETVAA